MEFIPADATLFRSAIDAMKESLPQAVLRISSEGLRINGMDASHVGFVDYYLTAADCTTLSVSLDVAIGINMSVLSRVLASVGTGDNVAFTLKKDILHIAFGNKKTAKKGSYEIHTLDIDADTLELPELIYGASVTAKTSDIGGVIKEVGSFGETMSLSLDEEGFHIATKGDFGTAKQTLDNSEGREMVLQDDTIVALFGTKYLTNLFKTCGSLCATTQIDFDSDKPMRCTFRFGTGSHYTAYLAPKVVD